MDNELKLLKIVLKADLTKVELKIVVYLLNTGDKTVKLTNPEMACACGILPANFRRALKKLEENQVVGRRKDGIYIRSINSWKASK